MKFKTKNVNKNRLLSVLLCLGGAAATGGLFSSCAYTETMNEREAEGHKLRQDLNYEIERGRKLQR